MICPLLPNAGVYVLGAMDATERTEFEDHLDECPACAREVRQLAGLPGLLAKVPVERLAVAPEPAPRSLLPGLLGRLDQTRRRRRRGRVTAAAAAAVLLVAGTVGVTELVRHDTPPRAEMGAAATPGSANSGETIQMRSRGEGLVTGWVTLTPVAWGTRIDLACSYADGGEADWTYAMIVRTLDGRRERVGSWKVGYGEDAAVSLPTAATPDEIKEIDVLTGDGDLVLELKR